MQPKHAIIFSSPSLPGNTGLYCFSLHACTYNTKYQCLVNILLKPLFQRCSCSHTRCCWESRQQIFLSKLDCVRSITYFTEFLTLFTASFRPVYKSRFRKMQELVYGARKIHVNKITFNIELQEVQWKCCGYVEKGQLKPLCKLGFVLFHYG
jgi:hypothetical protein